MQVVELSNTPFTSCLVLHLPASTDPGWGLSVSLAAWLVVCAPPVCEFPWEECPSPDFDPEAQESHRHSPIINRRDLKILHTWSYTRKHLDTHLSFLALIGCSSLNSCKADIELLDDGGVQTIEVQQQNELVIETLGQKKDEMIWEAQTCSMRYIKRQWLTDFWVEHQTSSICGLLPRFVWLALSWVTLLILTLRSGLIEGKKEKEKKQEGNYLMLKWSDIWSNDLIPDLAVPSWKTACLEQCSPSHGKHGAEDIRSSRSVHPSEYETAREQHYKKK